MTADTNSECAMERAKTPNPVSHLMIDGSSDASVTWPDGGVAWDGERETVAEAEVGAAREKRSYTMCLSIGFARRRNFKTL
jgi:hypothetical protein